MKLLSFDIEISDIFEGDEFPKDVDFHPCIASTVIQGGEERTWFSKNKDGSPTDCLETDTAMHLLNYLYHATTAPDFMVCAWNGLSFDLRWIGAVAHKEMAGHVAMRHYDPMFQFLMQRGFPVGLAAVGAGFGIKQEKLMTGAEAPKEWAKGNYEKVKEYVIGDSQITNQIVQAIIDAREVRWITKKGALKIEPMPKLLRVYEAMKLPRPDQSWMDTPLEPEGFYSWVPREVIQSYR